MLKARRQTGSQGAVRTVNRFFPNVRRVVEARHDIVIHVEPKDTAGSQSKDPVSCAFAQACKRSMRVDGAVISTTVAYLVKGDTAVRYEVPRSVQREIVVFDRFGPKGFATGEYHLNHMPKWRLLDAQRRKYKRQNRDNTRRTTVIRKKRPIHQTEGIRRLRAGPKS